MEEAGMDTRFVEESPGEPTLFSVCFLYPDNSGAHHHQRLGGGGA
jgi:hypothetical protein